MQAYVAGFLFNEAGTEVALIEKLKPAWQKGKLNAIGGKVETVYITDSAGNESIHHKESPIDAMVREFEEETGVFIPPSEWKYKIHLIIPEIAEIFFFTCFSDVIREVKTVEEEKVGIYEISNLRFGEPMIENLKWIVPFCLDKNITGPITVEEISTAKAA